jgi:ABC-type transport system involved in multi-copper enzyme maturation permease subunit
VLLGKYLVSVSWAVPVGLVSASLGAIVIGHERVFQLVTVECGLATLSCLSYAAVFLLIGVIVPKRAMVAGIVYAVVFEAAAALIPAAVNLFTIQYRLRCLLVRWMELDAGLVRGNPVFASYFGDESAAWHVAMLLGMTVGYLVAAALLLRFREFTAAAETES